MSVPASQRMLSSTQFVYNAFDLYKSMLHVCLSMPKRYTYMIAQPLLDKSRMLCDLCVKGNSIFPVIYEQDYMIRRKYLFEAKGVAHSISTDITALLYIKNSSMKEKGENSPLNSVRDSVLNTFLRLLDKEIDIIEKVINSDEKRFKDGNNNFITDKKVISYNMKKKAL